MACASIFCKNRETTGTVSKTGSSNENKTVWTHKLTHLYNVVVKQQPEIVTFHNGNVVSPVWTAEIKKNNISKV